MCSYHETLSVLNANPRILLINISLIVPKVVVSCSITRYYFLGLLIRSGLNAESGGQPRTEDIVNLSASSSYAMSSQLKNEAGCSHDQVLC